MGTAIIVEKKEMVQNYRYQDALDLYKDLKPTLNVTDEQYNMHVKAIKEQGTAPGEHEEIVKEVIPWDYNDRPVEFGEAYFNPTLTPDGKYHYCAINFTLPTDWEDYHQGTFKVYIPEDYTFPAGAIFIAMSGTPETATQPAGAPMTEQPVKEGNVYSAKILTSPPAPFAQSQKFITVYIGSNEGIDLELLKKDFRIDFIEE